MVQQPRGWSLRIIARTLVLRLGRVLSPPDRVLKVGAPERLPFKQEGYNYWRWGDHKIHYVVQGRGLPVLLVHGLGASLYHWRYNIPELAKHYEVYAMDLLGFGWSDKAFIDYDLSLWSNQVAAFLEHVVKKPAVVVGHSIGGVTALQAAADHPELVPGLALLNPAVIFETEKTKTANSQWLAFHRIGDRARHDLISFSFRQLSKFNQRLFVKLALNSVRCVVLCFCMNLLQLTRTFCSFMDKANVDDYLVESILHPVEDPNAAEVFHRMLSRLLFQPSDIFSFDKLLAGLSCPLLIVWGDWDPLASPSKADTIKELYDATTLVRLPAGHCPHDEFPERVNQELISWIRSIENQLKEVRIQSA